MIAGADLTRDVVAVFVVQAKNARPMLGEGILEGDVEEVGFHMISDNLEETMEKLNDVRAKRPKFVCINDDMDNPSEELLQNLQDFYQSFFPHPSRFELPAGQSNPPPLQLSVLRPKVVAKTFWSRATTFLLVIAVVSLCIRVVFNLTAKGEYGQTGPEE